MPIKQTTEIDFMNLLNSYPLDIQVDFICPFTHVSKNTSLEYIKEHYKYIFEIKDAFYDGIIITGAPVEKINFEDVDYWEELTDFFDWTRTHSKSTLYVCWGALAGLYYHHNIQKYVLEEKISGVYPHKILCVSKLLSNFDDKFFAPHSRYGTVKLEDVEACKELTILSTGEGSGLYIAADEKRREFFVTGHSEYAADTLNNEYHRDLKKGINPIIPVNYYKDNNPNNSPIVTWRAHSVLLFSNWLQYYCTE